ncbi:hypothetical protein GCM10009854_15310 [Saccharopolyspora halophila]|uniref:Uncharacterized protein n=1 Tax=Saccharopolyspora halophila TaxID=405551 RepID=A0ABP5SVL6_9PSEU
MTSDSESPRNRRMKGLGAGEVGEAARIAFNLERSSRQVREQRDRQDPRQGDSSTTPEE